jgi:putative transposase
MLVSCPPTLSVSKIMQYLKGHSSRMMQEEFESLRKRYWGQHLWSSGYFCRTVGSVTEEMIKEYIEQQIDEAEETFKIVDDDA